MRMTVKRWQTFQFFRHISTSDVSGDQYANISTVKKYLRKICCFSHCYDFLKCEINKLRGNASYWWMIVAKHVASNTRWFSDLSFSQQKRDQETDIMQEAYIQQSLVSCWGTWSCCWTVYFIAVEVRWKGGFMFHSRGLSRRVAV